MKKNIQIIYIVKTLIFFIIVIEYNYPEENSHYYPDAKQVSFKRKYLPDSLKVIKKIDLLDLDSDLYKPLFCNFDKNGNIYIIEYTNMIIYKIDPVAGDYLKFGNGKGKGPGELINPTDFKVNDTLIYLPDPKNNKVSIYSTKGNFIKDIKTSDKLPERIVVPSPDQIIITKQNEIEVNKYFSVYNFKGQLIDHFGYPLVEKETEDPSDKIMYCDGFLTETSETSFVYATCRTGYMGLYKNNRLVLRTTTVDGAQSPELEVKKFLKVFILTRIDNSAIHTACKVKNNGKYILIRAKNPEKDERYFDIYDTDRLQYIISLKLPRSMAYYDINDKYIAGLCDNKTKIVIYKMPHISAD